MWRGRQVGSRIQGCLVTYLVGVGTEGHIGTMYSMRLYSVTGYGLSGQVGAIYKQVG